MMIEWIVKTSNYLDHTIYTTIKVGLGCLPVNHISPDSPELSRRLERDPNHSMASRRRFVEVGGGGAAGACSHRGDLRPRRLLK